MLDVSVIILSYNSSKYLRQCIDSVFKFTKDVTFEVIVVDNNSTDDSADVLKSYGDRIVFIQSPENGGFSKGNNMGIRKAQGRFILLLNPDTLFLENTLYRMVVWMDGHVHAGVASCQLLDENRNILPTGGYEPTMTRIILWQFFLDDVPLLNKFMNSYHPKGGTSSIYVKDFEPDWVTGAFFFMRREAVEQIGLLDENIFMYAEELEWCMRARRFGFTIGYTPITQIVHLERRSSAGSSERAILGEIKGIRYICQKYYPPINQYTLDIIFVLGNFLRVILWLILLKPKIALIYLKAMVI